MVAQPVILSAHNGISPTRVAAKDLGLKFRARSFANIVAREIRFLALRMTFVEGFQQSNVAWDHQGLIGCVVVLGICGSIGLA